MLREVVKALHFLHSKRIIHLAINPRNILLGTDKNFKITDFGLGHFNNLKEIGENVIYQSPEVFKGNYNDTKSDIWSLGCVFYELCTLKVYIKIIK